MDDAIRGLWVALPTPLATGGAIDHAALVGHASRLLHAGCDGVVVFDTVGEGQSFCAIERLVTVEALLAAGIPPGSIALGAGFPMLRETAALVRSAIALGLRHMLLLPPYFYRDVGAEGIEDAFSLVIERVANPQLRATLYHAPQISGVPVPPAVAAKLRARYGEVVAGVTDASCDFAQFRAFRAAAPDIAITVGNAADIAAALAEGGVGAICGIANIALPLVQAMFRTMGSGAMMQSAITALGSPLVPKLKSVLAAQTGEAGWGRVRPPLRAADAGLGVSIAATLAALESLHNAAPSR
jgi:4-hydroxy-tetrahydrodipicolinate synthase